MVVLVCSYALIVHGYPADDVRDGDGHDIAAADRENDSPDKESIIGDPNPDDPLVPEILVPPPYPFGEYDSMHKVDSIYI